MSDEREYIAIRIKLPQPPEIRLADALLEACEANDLEVAQKLVKLGAKVNSQGFSICGNEERAYPVPLHHAVRHNNYDLINLLLEAGADVNLEADGVKPLHEVCWAQLRKEPPWLRKIVQATKDINKPDQQGFTVLHYAAKYAAPQFVEMLLNHGASVNESSQEYHVLCEVFQSKNPTIFRLIWNLTDKQLFKSLEDPENYIMLMLSFGWYKPDKVACLYDVLNVIDKFSKGSEFLFTIAMAEFGYNVSDKDEDAERKLMQTEWSTFEFGDPEFLKINICEVIRRLHAHGANLSTPHSRIAIVYFCYKHNISKSIQRQHELLNTMIDLSVDFSDFIINFAQVNYPKFALILLKYCSINPSELFKYTVITERCDIPYLNYITTLLMLCSPPRACRIAGLMNIVNMFNEVGKYRFHTYTANDFEMKPYFLCINKSEFEDPFVRKERYALLLKVHILLEADRIPTLQELARNCIRLCMKDKTSQEFLHAVDSLNVPEYITDIIQCRAPVCSFRESDLGDVAAPVFPFSDFQPRSNSTSSILPHNLQTFQHENNLSPLLIHSNYSNEAGEQILPDNRYFLDLEREEQTNKYVKKCKKILCPFLSISILIISAYYLLKYVTR